MAYPYEIGRSRSDGHRDLLTSTAPGPVFRNEDGSGGDGELSLIRLQNELRSVQAELSARLSEQATRVASLDGLTADLPDTLSALAELAGGWGGAVQEMRDEVDATLDRFKGTDDRSAEENRSLRSDMRALEDRLRRELRSDMDNKAIADRLRAFELAQAAADAALEERCKESSDHKQRQMTASIRQLEEKLEAMMRRTSNDVPSRNDLMTLEDKLRTDFRADIDRHVSEKLRAAESSRDVERTAVEDRCFAFVDERQRQISFRISQVEEGVKNMVSKDDLSAASTRQDQAVTAAKSDFRAARANAESEIKRLSAEVSAQANRLAALGDHAFSDTQTLEVSFQTVSAECEKVRRDLINEFEKMLQAEEDRARLIETDLHGRIDQHESQQAGDARSRDEVRQEVNTRLQDHEREIERKHEVHKIDVGRKLESATGWRQALDAEIQRANVAQDAVQTRLQACETKLAGSGREAGLASENASNALSSIEKEIRQREEICDALAGRLERHQRMYGDYTDTLAKREAKGLLEVIEGINAETKTAVLDQTQAIQASAEERQRQREDALCSQVRSLEESLARRSIDRQSARPNIDMSSKTAEIIARHTMGLSKADLGDSLRRDLATAGTASRGSTRMSIPELAPAPRTD